MRSVHIEEIAKLSVVERIELVEDIWDTIAAAPESLPVTDAQRQEIDRRVADYREHPHDVRPWPQIRDSLAKLRCPFISPRR